VGVHTPEFPFEIRLQRAGPLKRHASPIVAQDNEQQTWNPIANQYWPPIHLDQSGKSFQHTAKPVEQMDRTIARLLNASS